jgi:hypothetical protein
MNSLNKFPFRKDFKAASNGNTGFSSITGQLLGTIAELCWEADYHHHPLNARLQMADRMIFSVQPTYRKFDMGDYVRLEWVAKGKRGRFMRALDSIDKGKGDQIPTLWFSVYTKAEKDAQYYRVVLFELNKFIHHFHSQENPYTLILRQTLSEDMQADKVDKTENDWGALFWYDFLSRKGIKLYVADVLLPKEVRILQNTLGFPEAIPVAL